MRERLRNAIRDPPAAPANRPPRILPTEKARPSRDGRALTDAGQTRESTSRGLTAAGRRRTAAARRTAAGRTTAAARPVVELRLRHRAVLVGIPAAEDRGRIGRS